MPEIITCENLVKIYKIADLEVLALQGLELTVQEGELMAIAVALANEPSILLGDEPTGDLDSVTALTIYEALGTLNQELGITLFSSSAMIPPSPDTWAA